jgi:hypothetical protein
MNEAPLQVMGASSATSAYRQTFNTPSHFQ